MAARYKLTYKIAAWLRQWCWGSQWGILSKKQREKEHELNKSQIVNPGSLAIFCSPPGNYTSQNPLPPGFWVRYFQGKVLTQGLESREKEPLFYSSSWGLVTRRSPYPTENHCVAVMASYTFRFLGHQQFPLNLGSQNLSWVCKPLIPYIKIFPASNT